MLQTVGGSLDPQGPTMLARITGLEERQAKFEEEIRERLRDIETDLIGLFLAIGMRAKHVGVPKAQSGTVSLRTDSGSLGQSVPAPPPGTPYPYPY